MLMLFQRCHTVDQMIERNLRLTVVAKRGNETVPVMSRFAGRQPVIPAAIECAGYVASAMRQSPFPGRWHQNGLMRSSTILACLTLGLGACSQPVDCSGGTYRGGCVPGVPGSATASPVAASPAAVGPAGSGPANPGLGDPAAFADVDDKQCRSYGLIFGTHDYADCRIRLSAQHRGLDPNIGTTTPVPPSR